MAQPSGRILGFPSAFSFVLRCSPLVCAVNAVDSVIRLIVYTAEERNISKAADHFATVRFKDIARELDGSLEALRHNALFRWLLFIFGALVPAIKVYATSNILPTQICCSAFLASFAIDELILLGRRRNAQPVELSSQQFSRSNRDRTWVTPVYETYAFVVLWTSIYLSVVLHLEYRVVAIDHTGGISQGLHFLLRSTQDLPLVILLFTGMWYHLFGISSNVIMLFIGQAIGEFLYYRACDALMEDNSGQQSASGGTPGGPPGGIAWRLALLALGLWSVFVWTVTEINHLNPEQRRRIGFYLSVCYVGTHLHIATSYYRVHYDPRTAFKPAWTNVLG